MGKRPLNEAEIAVRRKKSKQSVDEENSPVCGILKKIDLKNFMNHAQLSFDFQSRVNFVTGRNGTGKSALLTGLVIGLGGKASATSRGSTLAGFIQHGKQVAEVKITLHNAGPNAYKPEVYGDHITVERKLFRNSPNEYRIKTSTGHQVSNKKQDLTRILDHFNIQIENPVCILNQDTSKNFLCSKNPCDVYKFFLKATQIEQMQDALTNAQCEFDSTLKMLKCKESTLPAMKLELKQAEDRATALESLDKLRETLLDKQRELAWVVVQQKERKYEQMQQKVSKQQKDRAKYEKKVSDARATVVTVSEKVQTLEQKLIAMAGSCHTLPGERGELKKVLGEKRQKLRTDEAAVKQQRKELSRLQNDKKTLEDRIKDLEASSQQDKSTQRRARDERVERLRERMRTIEQGSADSKAQMNTALHSLTGLRETKHELLASVGDCQRIKKGHQQRIAEMEKARSNKILRYGKYWPALLEEVEKAHKAGKFKKKPYGPLGTLITIKDMRYALAAERALGSVMTSFFVDNVDDKKLIEQIERKVCGNDTKPGLMIGKFVYNKFDVSRDRAHTRFPTLHDIITVEDSVVYNCIIDEISPHNVVLVLDGKEARSLMRDNQPRNCHVCYDQKGDEIRQVPYRVLANKYDRPRYLSTNVEEDISATIGSRHRSVDQDKERAEAVKLSSVSTTLGEEQGKLDQITLKIQSTSETHNQLKATVGNKEKQLRKIAAEIEDLTNQNLEDEQSDGNIDVLISDRDNYNRDIEQVESVLQTAIERYDQSKKETDEVCKQLSVVAEKLREFIDAQEPLKMELQAAQEEVSRAENDSAHYQAQLKQFDATLKQKETELANYHNEHVQKDIEIASQMSQRITSNKPPESLQAEMKKIKQRLSQEEELRGDATEIRRNLEEVSEKYYTAKRQLAHCTTYKKEMTKALKQRRSNLYKIIYGTSTMIKMWFIKLLHQRNYDGKLEFDHDDRKLEIIVHPSDSQATGDRRISTDLRSLSGGEKSFSTLCFMMSLWEAVATPFRCMDEFDVFMDMVNRKVSVRMITEFAKSKSRDQFVLITPQDTSFMAPMNFVHIYRMPDPIRSGKRPHPDDDDNEGTR